MTGIGTTVPAYDALVERAGGRSSHSPARAGLSENENLSFSNIIAIECRSASAIRQKLSILATQERAAGALIDRQRSAFFLRFAE
jgi:hypothetical protein